jgi:hypothetical protein
MEEIKLPIIKGSAPFAKWLSMEDYIKFINLHLRYTLDKKTARQQKNLAKVNVPFSLK